jgi:hypothetical protein
LFAIQFSLHRMAVSYHCLGISSEGWPSIMAVTWSWI